MLKKAFVFFAPLKMCASLAQLDRVFGYEPKGRGFESLTTRQKKARFGVLFFYIRPVSSYTAGHTGADAIAERGSTFDRIIGRIWDPPLLKKDDCFRNRLFLPKSDQKVRKYSEERLKVHHSYCSINLNLIIQQ